MRRLRDAAHEGAGGRGDGRLSIEFVAARDPPGASAGRAESKPGSAASSGVSKNSRRLVMILSMGLPCS
jgi:hypothetical protein